MNSFHSAPQDKDPELWALAKKRAGFKRDLVFYLVINAFLWMVWLLSGAKVNSSGIPWPVWSTAGWGVGMLFYYLSVFRFSRDTATEKEYQKLINKK